LARKIACADNKDGDPYSVTLLAVGAGYFRAKPFPVGYPNYSQFWSFITYNPMKMEQCSETSAYTIQTPGNYPKENIQHVLGYLTVVLSYQGE